MKTITLKLGRFHEEIWIAAFTGIAKIQAATRIRTKSELAALEIKQSIREDLKTGVKPHDSGNDVKSLALEAIADLEGDIKRETDAQALEALKESLIVLDAARLAIQEQITIFGGKAISAGDARANEIALAKANKAKKEAAKRVEARA